MTVGMLASQKQTLEATLSFYDVVVIGTGPAGLTAAIYTTRGGFKTAIFAGIQHGGQLTTTTEVENFPGFRDPVMGQTLMNDMTSQAERLGAEVIYDEITKVDFSSQPLRLWAGESEIKTKAVIIATGATAKTLGLPHESELMGRGVSTCATCDGFFYKGKRAAVVGGGDSAMEEANYLSKLCSEVLLIHRRPQFRASNIMIERTKNNPKIRMLIPYAVEDTIAGPHGLTAIVVRNLDTNKLEEIPMDGLWMAVGHTPNSRIFKDFVDTDENGYIVVEHGTKTRSPGVFAAGDIADHEFRQAITAAGMGCQAGMQAIRFLEAQG
jgi:thioredoxin reductase (NADPH)